MSSWLKRVFGKKETDAYMESMERSIKKAIEQLPKERAQTEKLIRASGLSSDDVEELFQAARKGDHERVRMLISTNRQLARFKDVRGNTALHETLMSHGRGFSTQLTIAQMLLDAGADADDRDTFGTNPLFFAVGSDNPKLVELLIAHGANIRNRNNAGREPIHATHYAPILDLLLQNGADINARDNDGKTLLSLWLFNHSERDEFSVYIKSKGGLR